MNRRRASAFKVTLSSLLILRILAGSGLIMSCLSAWPIARHPGDDDRIPQGLINATVRIRTKYEGTSDTTLGSGIVIKIHRDSSGPGGWLCVLTADHVVARGREWDIGFGNGGGPGTWQLSTVPPHLVEGPRGPEPNTWVDLAVLGVHALDLSILPPLTLPQLSGEVSYYVTQMGFGDTGTIGDPRRYNIVQGYGTFRSGVNTIDGTSLFRASDPDPRTGKIYSFTSLEGDLDFFPQPPPPVWPPRLGESHPLRGDSGGPSLQSDGMGNWLLVGILAFSETDANYTFVQEGQGWVDVRVGSYLNWINDACQQAIPEPASMTALSAGLLFLTISRLRRKP